MDNRDSFEIQLLQQFIHPHDWYISNRDRAEALYREGLETFKLPEDPCHVEDEQGERCKIIAVCS